LRKRLRRWDSGKVADVGRTGLEPVTP
jgi:hypothetical protein